MDKKKLFSNFSDSDFKLTRAASFSELSTTKKVFVEQRFKSELCGNLVKQYSCEKIFDHHTNTSRLEVSQVIKSDNKDHQNVWRSLVPNIQSSTDESWLMEIDKPLILNEKFYDPTQIDPLSRMDKTKSKNILTPAKLIINDDLSKQSRINNENNQFKNNLIPVDSTVYNQSLLQLKKISSSSSSLKEDKYDKIEHNSNSKEDKYDKIEQNPNLKEDKYDKIEHNPNNSPIDKKNLNAFTQRNISEARYIEENYKLNKRLNQLTRRTEIKEPIRKRRMFSFNKSLILKLLLPMLIAYLIFAGYNANVVNDLCKPRFKFDKLPYELNKYIHSQEMAIYDLNSHFKKKHNETGFDVVAFIGGTGVGKSYTFEVIKNTLKETDNTLDIYPPLYTKKDKVLSLLTVCRCNLIRLENLKTDDIPDAVNFIANLRNKAKNYCVLVLAIFNTQEIDETLKWAMDFEKSNELIDKKFKEADLKIAIVNFKSMTMSGLKKCVYDAAEYNNVDLSEKQIESVTRDLIIADSGCKGANAKVQVAQKTVKD